jgi:UDP-N-acetylmuramoyl-tripeptide--D-alanyl-D-alanine ligase
MNLKTEDLLSIPHRVAHAIDAATRWNATGVSTDSRNVNSGDVFVAIRGERFDGHNFVSTAVEQGAVAVIVDARWASSNGQMLARLYLPRLVVDDTVDALGSIARIVRRQFDIPVIAVGGSNGKTTTKEMIRSVLAQRLQVLATEGNLNNQIGVPQTLFRLDKKHDVAVIEVGTNHPGEIAHLCAVAEPTHGLLTNIGREHLEHFGSVEGVARAEGELWDWLAANWGTAFVNGDDAHIVRSARKVNKKVVYGFRSRTAAIKGSRLTTDDEGRASLSVRKGSKAAFRVQVAVPGLHNGFNALAAAAVGLSMGVAPTKIVEALSGLTAASKRMQVVHVNGVTILNDTYNANPDSVLAALATLSAYRTDGRRIAVLGDMFELGSAATESHRLVGRAVRRERIDLLLATGPFSQETVRASGMASAEHHPDKSSLVRRLQSMLQSGDVVLVKGSRGMQMEDVVSAITSTSRSAA